MKTAILFILMMLVLIAPHEFGHFIVAKLCNVQVNEFSVGMGPLLWKKKKGETQYSIRLIPIGGYCAMEGEDESSENPRAFNNKGPLQRSAILLAGVTMNVIIAILACTIAFQISGVPVNRLDSVIKSSPAYEAGLKAGDKIVAVDGVKTDTWDKVTNEISCYAGSEKLEITIERNGSRTPVFLTPQWNDEKQSYTIGIVADVSRNPLTCTVYGAQLTGTLTGEMFKTFGMLFGGKLSKDDVSGPVGLVKVVGQTSQAGAGPFLLLLALVSLNLALMNLLPIPGLDGGKLLFVILKWISRGRINDDMEIKATVAGMMLLIALFVFITINDIGNLFK